MRTIAQFLPKSQFLNNPKKTVTIMKRYLKPEFEIFEVAVEGGYGDSVLLPGFGSESDELTY